MHLLAIQPKQAHLLLINTLSLLCQERYSTTELRGKKKIDKQLSPMKETNTSHLGWGWESLSICWTHLNGVALKIIHGHKNLRATLSKLPFKCRLHWKAVC